MDLQQRNDIIHEGSLKIEDTGGSLKLMTWLFKLLFKILQYEYSIDIFSEDDWQVMNYNSIQRRNKFFVAELPNRNLINCA